ncbi:hypothetical protein PWT90_07957 [Aphanocladium album]|nr:hypothetical protein PWT90_07957 [Aphanocladium album]
MVSPGGQGTIPSNHLPQQQGLLSPDRNANNKRPLSFDNNADFLESFQRVPTGERGFATEPQLQFGQQWHPQLQHQQPQQQYQPQQTQQSLVFQPQELEFAESLLDSAAFDECLSSLPSDPLSEAQLFTPPQQYEQLYNHHHQQQAQLAQTAPHSLPFDLNTGFDVDTLLPTPGISPQQGPFEYPAAADVVFSPPPPACPTPPLHRRTVLPRQPSQPAATLAPRPSVPQKTSPRPVRPTMTTATAAAALSKTSSSSASSVSFPASSSSFSAAAASTTYTLPPHAMLRFGGYTLEEAGITLPANLSTDERARRMHLLALELHYEAVHPPVLPPSQVPDLPEKPPPVPLPVLRDDMPDEEREATEAEIRDLLAEQKKLDQERNNLAAKKSRLLRLECLDNTRLQLNAKAAECAWLRLQLVALTGWPSGRLLPSAAWGGSEYVYRAKPGGPSLRAGDSTGEGEEAEYLVLEADETEAEADEEMDREGVVPRKVKEGITEEVRARVEAHKERLGEEQKKKTSVTRTQRNQAKAEAKATATATASTKQPRRSSKSSSKR